MKSGCLQENRINISYHFYIVFESWKELLFKLQQINMVEITVPWRCNVMQNTCKQVLHNILLWTGFAVGDFMPC